MKAFLFLSIEKLSRWIRDVLSDDGNQSSMRLILLLAWACVLLVWTVLSLTEHKLLEIPASVFEVLSAATIGKCWQNHVEAKRQATVDTPAGA